MRCQCSDLAETRDLGAAEFPLRFSSCRRVQVMMLPARIRCKALKSRVNRKVEGARPKYRLIEPDVVNLPVVGPARPQL